MMVVRNIGSSCIEMNESLERVGPCCLVVFELLGMVRLDTQGAPTRFFFIVNSKVLSVAIE